MKTLNLKMLIASLILSAQTLVYAQTDPCKTEIVSKQMKDAKKEAEKYAKKFKDGKITSDATIKEAVKNEYTTLQEGYNKVYSEIKDDIAAGLMFVGEKRLCKTKYYLQLQALDKQTIIFMSKKRTIDKGIPKSGAGVGEIIIAVVSVLEKVYSALESAAENKADKFYEKLAWKSYDEL